MTRPSRPVHQLFFGWSKQRSQHTVIAHSTDARSVDMWASRLDLHVRLLPAQNGEMPRTALSFLDLGHGATAVVHRSDIGHSDGRANTHVLLDESGSLDFSLALALEHWRGWRTDVPEHATMEVLDAGDLETELDPLDWRPEAERVETAVRIVLSALLHQPGRPLSVIGCPDDDKLPLVWCLREAARSQLPSWSFSTHEIRHDDSIKYLPQVVFMPEVLFSGSANRTIVDVRKNLPITPMASQLVEHVLHGTPAPPHLNETPRREPERVATMTQRTHRAPDISGALLERLLNASTAGELLKALQDLSDGRAPDRARLRGRVTVADINRITAVVEHTVTAELHRKLLHGMYGQKLEDLGDKHALEHLHGAVEDVNSRQWPKIAAREAKEHGYSSVVTVAGERLIAEDNQLPPVKNGPVRRTANRLRRKPFTWAAAGCLFLLILGATLWFGIWLGTPAAQQVVRGPATTQSTAPETQAPATASPGVAKLVAAPAANRLVYGFVQLEDSYYPQAPCSAADQTSTRWRCVETGNPPPRNGVKPAFVAVVVPLAQLERFNQASLKNVAVERAADWGETAVVPTG